MYCLPPSLLDSSGKYRNPVGHTVNAQLMSKDWPNNLIDTAEVYEYNNETLTINNSHKTDGLENNLDNSHYSFQRTLNYTVDGSMTI